MFSYGSSLQGLPKRPQIPPAWYNRASAIIHVDYPEQWPHLLDWLKHNLQQDQQVCGALFVLRILLENVMDMGT
ncbi:hypothetical protein LWI28_027055 [Acer negundo]|uniref:Uncharacterized protein n=1 Tax=Acer negundo TaxID=4023 RepID=A0AAD5P524_ACENE|nr:hypothetical protein LWI28_027055 [Acer negundo]KAK4859067.1 hypothetical protein QYF36_026275 [Acer negundo]